MVADGYDAIIMLRCGYSSVVRMAVCMAVCQCCGVDIRLWCGVDIRLCCGVDIVSAVRCGYLSARLWCGVGIRIDNIIFICGVVCGYPSVEWCRYPSVVWCGCRSGVVRISV